MNKNKDGSVKYPENRDIRKLLKKNDMVEIAKLSGKSVHTVRGVMSGERNNDEIIAWAKRIIADRKRRLDQIENPDK